MKTTTKELYSSASMQNKNLENTQNKIEVFSCPRNEMICQEHLSVINKCYAESDQYFLDKEYNRSIDSLLEAFYKTTDLVETPCNKCAGAFRSLITESLENIQYDLVKMTSGIFGKNSYKPSCLKATTALHEFENFKLHNSYQENKTKERYIENYAKRKVS